MVGLKGFFCVTAFFMVIHVCADDRAATVEALLKEIRELKQAQRKESRQAKEEFRELQRILDLRTKAADADAKTLKALNDRISELKTKLADDTAKAEGHEKQLTQLAATIEKSATQLSDRAKGNSFILTPAAIKTLTAVLTGAKGTGVPERCAGLLSVLLDSANDAVRTRLVNRAITLDGAEIHVEAIHFGSLFVLWRTLDGSRCGYGASDGKQTTFAELPESEQKGIDRACRILRNEEPSTVLQLPVPTKGADK